MEVFPSWLLHRPAFQAILKPGLLGGSSGDSPLITACKRPPDERQAHDLLVISRALRSSHSLFTLTLVNNDEQLDKLAQAVEYDGHDTGQDVVIQGDPGDYFYLVIAGKLDVIVHGLGVVARLGEGNTFGELALTQMTFRQATVRCATPCSLLRLHRDDYQRILANSHSKWLTSLVRFLHDVPLFEGWSKNRLRRLAMVLCTQNVTAGKEVIEQGQPADKLYFIRLGKLDLVHHTSVSTENKWPLPPEVAAAAAKGAAETECRRSLAAPPASVGGHVSKAKADPVNKPSSRRSSLPGAAASSSTHMDRTIVQEPDSIDYSGRFPMGTHRVTLVEHMTMGEVSAGCLYGLAQATAGGVQPFSLVAKTDVQVLYINAAYLRPNQLANKKRNRSMSLPGDARSQLPGYLRLLREDTVGDFNQGPRGPACADQISAATAHAQLHPPRQLRRNSAPTFSPPQPAGVGPSPSTAAGVAAADALTRVVWLGREMNNRTGSTRDIIGASSGARIMAPPSSTAHPPAAATPVSTPSVCGATPDASRYTMSPTRTLTSHPSQLLDTAGVDDSSYFSVSSLLRSLEGTGVHIHPESARYLRGFHVGKGVSKVARSLLDQRRAAATALIPLHTKECERILRRMMTRLDEDNFDLRMERERQLAEEQKLGGK